MLKNYYYCEQGIHNMISLQDLTDKMLRGESKLFVGFRNERHSCGCLQL